LFERNFDLDGLVIRVASRGADIETVLRQLLGGYAVVPSGLPAMTVELDRTRVAPRLPARAPRFRFPPLFAFALEDGTWHLVDDVAELHIEPAAGRVRGAVRADASLRALSQFAGLTLWVALLECLRARGRYSLHAAAMISPAGEVALFPGAKQAGKSTISLALFDAGWSILTDDLVFFERAPEGALTLFGFAKQFHIRPDLLARRPDLAALVRHPAPFEPQDKRWLALAERWPERTRRSAGAPTWILFPEIVSETHTRRIDLGARQALLALLGHSSFVFVHPDLAPDHLDLLRTLVDGAPSARLLCGRDVLSDPSIYLDFLPGGQPWFRAASASR